MQEPGGGTENHEQTAQSSGTAVGKFATEKNLEFGSPRTPALITAVTSAVIREVGGFRFIYLHLQGADEGGWGGRRSRQKSFAEILAGLIMTKLFNKRWLELVDFGA